MFPLFSKIIVASFCFLSLAACKTSPAERPVPEIPPADTSITVENAYVPLFLDSVYVSSYAAQRGLNQVEAAELAGFYSSRNYQYAWFDSVGVTQQALHFLNRLDAFNSVFGAMPALLDPLEWRIGRGNACGIDADHAALDQIGNPVGLAAIFRKDECGKPVRQAVGLFDGFVECSETRGHDQRAEWLLVHRAGFDRYVCEHGRLKIESLAVDTLTAGQDTRAVGNGILDH